jgi:hypothetical protein
MTPTPTAEDVERARAALAHGDLLAFCHVWTRTGDRYECACLLSVAAPFNALCPDRVLAGFRAMGRVGAEGERDDARRMLAECYVLSGADTDGNTVESGWEHLWRDAVAEVRTLREGYDEAVDGPAVHPSDCQSCSEDPNPCRTHAEDWRYWRARALDFEEGASVEAREADRGREEVARLRAAFGMDSPWPLLDVLARLADAADHLHTDHNCDTHGWETVRAAAEHARVYVDRLRAALLPSPPAQTEETP